jgi:hypothetical protein
MAQVLKGLFFPTKEGKFRGKLAMCTTKFFKFVRQHVDLAPLFHAMIYSKLFYCGRRGAVKLHYRQGIPRRGRGSARLLLLGRSR